MKRSRPKSRGYSAESLQMLETEEGQVNAVFACFGSAAQHAQLFEQALGRFLAVYNEVVNADLSVEDFEAYQRKTQRMTMGALLRELKRHVRIENEVVTDQLEYALKRRNHLMHAFFLERDDGFRSEEGRMELLKELLDAEKLLDTGRITLNAMRIAMCRKLGVEDKFSADDRAG